LTTEPTFSAKEELGPIQSPRPKDFGSFVNFFKGYMGVMPLVMASFAPIVTLANAIPTYALQTKALSTMTGLLGFLLVAWAFSSRHALAIRFFFNARKARNPSRWLRFSLVRSALGIPFLLIILMIGFYFAYSWTLEHSIMVSQADQLRRDGGLSAANNFDDPAAVMARTPDKSIPLRSDILKEVNYRIPYGTYLAVRYVGIFLCAELAFVFMALREYMQAVLQLSDGLVIERLTGE
jgi:hypothetical protein